MSINKDVTRPKVANTARVRTQKIIGPTNVWYIHINDREFNFLQKEN